MLAAAGAVAACGSNSGRGVVVTTRAVVPADALVLVDPARNRVVRSVRLRAAPTRVAYGDGAFWAVAPEDRLVLRVDPNSGALRRFTLGELPYDVNVGAGAVWVPDHDGHRLLRLDGASGEVRQTKLLGGPAVAAGYGFGSVWVIVVPGSLVRVDPQTLAVTRVGEDIAAPVEGAEPKLLFTDDALWITSPGSTSLARVDRNGKVESKRQVSGLVSATVAGDDAWIVNNSGFAYRLGDAAATRTRVGYSPVDITDADGDVWVAEFTDSAVKRLEPDEAGVAATITLSRKPVAMAAGAGLLAVAVAH